MTGGPFHARPTRANCNSGTWRTVNNPDHGERTGSRIAGLLTVPHQKYNGIIAAMFQIDDINRGDRFQA